MCPFGVKRTKNVGVSIPPHPRNDLAGAQGIMGVVSFIQCGYCFFVFSAFEPPPLKETLSFLSRLKLRERKGK